MNTPKIEDLLKVMAGKGYRVYDTPSVDWNVNLVGVRAQVTRPDKFDDLLLVFQRFMGIWELRSYQITTDPSPYYLRKPINSAGTAVLKEGQYKGVWKLDVHQRGASGAHKALCQRLGDVTVYRDKNKDGVLDLDPAKEQTGRFGINIHRGPRNGKASNDNTVFSAGCQVFADDRKFDEFLLICENAAAAFGNKFTYTLLNEKDFN